MATTAGCGCKICKANLGEYINQLIISGFSPKDVLKTLQERNVKTTEKLLKKHLSAFEIPYPESDDSEMIECEPIKVDLNKIDFFQYNFDYNDIESIIAYLQKINLKIYLNQTRITLQAQQDVIDGKSPDMPKEIMHNLAVAFQILDKSTGVSTHVNQQEAIKVVEAMGLTIQRPVQFYLQDVQNNANSETN
jgi:hypothetical protein